MIPTALSKRDLLYESRDVDLLHFLSTSLHWTLYVPSRRSYKKDDQVTTFLSRTSWWHNYIQNIECVWKLSDSCTGDYWVAQRSSNNASRSLTCPRAVVTCVARKLTIHDATQYLNNTIITALAVPERHNLKLAFGGGGGGERSSCRHA